MTEGTAWNIVLHSEQRGATMLQQYLTELKKIKMLSPEEERELWIREEEGDEEAHQKLISSYQPLVFKTAVQFHMPEDFWKLRRVMTIQKASPLVCMRSIVSGAGCATL